MTWDVTDTTMNVATGTKGLCVESDDPRAPGAFEIEHACPNGQFSDQGKILAHALANLLNRVDQHRLNVAMQIDEHGHPRMHG